METLITEDKSMDVTIRNENRIENDDVDARQDDRSSWKQRILSSMSSKRSSSNVEPIALPVDRNAVEYNMEHRKRGLAVIFNQENFDDEIILKPRFGTDADCRNLKSALEELSFEVEVFKDLSCSGIQKEVEKLSKVDHSNYDCLFISVLTYGHVGYLYAKDKQYRFEMIKDLFTADNCTSLAGKPKIFLIQACTFEEMVVSSRSLFGSVQTDSSERQATFTIPIHADCLIVYSTIPGIKSWLQSENGCVFIQCLCIELRGNGRNKEIMELLAFMKQRMARVDNQVPCVKTMLTRFLYFREKGKLSVQ